MMELKQNNRVFFDPVSHSYTLDGEKLLLGVTELMRKHNLGADYSGIPERVLQKAAEEGTAIHQEIEDFDDGKTFFSNDLLDQYSALCLNSGLKSVASEYLVSDNELIASSIDKVYERGGGAFLVDIKTTTDYHRRSVEAQLGIYKYLFGLANPGIPVVGCACLWIDKKKRIVKQFFPVEPMPEKEVLDLLDCERKGLIYIREEEKPSAELVLNDTELCDYISFQSNILEFKKRIKEIESQMKAYDERILDYMQKNKILEMEAPGGVFNVKKSYSRTSLDTDALKESYPQIYKNFEKEVIVKASLTFKPNK